VVRLLRHWPGLCRWSAQLRQRSHAALEWSSLGQVGVAVEAARSKKSGCLLGTTEGGHSCWVGWSALRVCGARSRHRRR
jgi:cellulase/cellobiase CelA1